MRRRRLGGGSGLGEWQAVAGVPHVDDLADAAVFLMNTYDAAEIVNVGVGEDVSIGELAEMARLVVGFEADCLRFFQTR